METTLYLNKEDLFLTIVSMPLIKPLCWMLLTMLLLLPLSSSLSLLLMLLLLLLFASYSMFTCWILALIRSGKNWVHVSCSLWIPEVGFGSVEKMEPVTRVENIPVSLMYIDKKLLWRQTNFKYIEQFSSLYFKATVVIKSKYITSFFLYLQQSRWNLVCSICREKVGACIQCTVSTLSCFKTVEQLKELVLSTYMYDQQHSSLEHNEPFT